MHLDLKDRRTQLGIALVVLGALALFANTGLFEGFSRLVGLALFGAAGVLVIGMYRQEPSRLWALPVGFGLLGLAVATLELPWSGGAFLGSIGLGFLAIWLLDPERKRWWALIPTGVLLTLGVVAAWDEMSRGGDQASGTIFFLGLAATFAALYLLPSVQQRWAIWPALALGVIAVLTLSFSGGWIAPILLIVVGGWLLTRQSRPSDVRPVEPSAPPPAPAPSPAPRSAETETFMTPVATPTVEAHADDGAAAPESSASASLVESDEASDAETASAEHEASLDDDPDRSGHG